jgi:5-methylcytosine-specific restriction enzyme B
MARYCAEKETASKFEAAGQWKEKCLLNGRSIFSEQILWTVENVDALDTFFVNNLDEGEGNFFEKLESQLEPTDPAVKMLAAEMMWFMLLCPSNIGSDKKRQSISRIWSWSGHDLDMSAMLLSDEVLDGIGSGGTSYNTNRWRELVYFIQLLKRFMPLTKSDRMQSLESGWEFAKWLETVPENNNRQLRHMLLFLLFPDDFERIFGGTDRRAVVLAFTGKAKRVVGDLSALDIDRELAAIRQQQVEDFDTDQLDFYVAPLREQWKDKSHSHWLFTWNPDNWVWDNIDDAIATTREGKTVVIRWSCSNSKVSSGDKAWLIRLGVVPKGIMATGNVISEPYDEVHWDQSKANDGVTCQYVDIEFTRVIDVFNEHFASLEELEKITLDQQRWTPQTSGIEIKKRSAGLLEKLWNQQASKPSITHTNIPNRAVNEPVNTILYGPPGTGKTYQLNKRVERYTVQSTTRDQWLVQELHDARWFDVIFMSLYLLGGKAKVADVAHHDFVLQKAKAIGRNKNIKQQIWVLFIVPATTAQKSSNSPSFSGFRHVI